MFFNNIKFFIFLNMIAFTYKGIKFIMKTNKLKMGGKVYEI